jgi:hypothetical protein
MTGLNQVLKKSWVKRSDPLFPSLCAGFLRKN